MAKHRFKEGNQYGRLSAGVPRPSSTTNFKTIIKAVMDSYSLEEIVEMFHRLDEDKQLYFINEMSKQQKDHLEKILKMKLDRERYLNPPTETNTIDIKLIENTSDDSESDSQS